MINYQEKLNELSRTNRNHLTSLENIILRVHSDWQDKIKTGDSGMVGFIDIEKLLDINEIMKSHNTQVLSTKEELCKELEEAFPERGFYYSEESKMFFVINKDSNETTSENVFGLLGRDYEKNIDLLSRLTSFLRSQM